MLIHELLQGGHIRLNKEMCLECKLNFQNKYVFWNDIPDYKYPTEVKLLFH